MKKLIFVIITIVPSVGLYSQVGINVAKPTATLDVNGDVKVRNLPVAGSNAEILVSDENGYISKQDYTQFRKEIIGDIKDAIQDQDHHGWFLLNGRSISTLPSVAKQNAISLGFSSALPDFRNKLSKSKNTAGSLGTIGGKSSITLSRNNLPAFELNGRTSSAGKHDHIFVNMINHANGGGMTLNAQNTGAKWGSDNTIRTTSISGAHSHNITLKSNGSGTAFNLTPGYISLKQFVYLGK
ncbi:MULTISPECIES: hypothetical protein [Chryseobacterium]|uniref:Uncharacterized protein n=2 Tax=Chryseobacterium TaxID=59732 RepID=A0A543EJK4_9FLAO|nr:MULTISPECIES: hypothetical protein [Chryseobacterium]MDR6458216.1 hypothetical protein [Chryseobacterium vietnamense]TQM21768.1 hypothetical protein FB551_1462 [Chryseobacterium aquifrigidense]